MNEQTISPERTAGYCQWLRSEERVPSTVNSMLAALHAFFRFSGWEDCRASCAASC